MFITYSDSGQWCVPFCYNVLSSKLVALLQSEHNLTHSTCIAENAYIPQFIEKIATYYLCRALQQVTVARILS